MLPRLMLAGLIGSSEQILKAAMQHAGLTAEDLAPMSGKVLKFSITDLHFDLWITCGDSQWWLSTDPQGDPDVSLSGTLGNLIETARSMTKPDSPLIFEGLDIRGSVGVLQTMQRMFQALDLDWEDMVTRAVGPVAGQALIQFIKASRAQWKTSRESIARQAEDFVRMEQSTVLTHQRFDPHTQAVSQLMRQIDRMQARLKRLETKHA